jgi:hypothetical protein
VKLKISRGKLKKVADRKERKKLKTGTEMEHMRRCCV